MEKLSLSLIFVLLFTSSFSIRPKNDTKILPKYSYNISRLIKNITQKNKETQIYRYFSFNQKDIPKESEEFLFFQIDSSLSPKNISYIFINEHKQRSYMHAHGNFKYNIWQSPNIIFKQKFNDKIIYQFPIPINKFEMSQETIIIRVGPLFKDEKCICEIARNISSNLKNLVNKKKEDKRDISKDYKWKKPKYDRNNYSHSWDNEINKYKYDKYNRNRMHHINEFRNIIGRIVFAVLLIFIWSLIFIVYCLVNRRKKPVINMIKNEGQISLYQYHNV